MNLVLEQDITKRKVVVNALFYGASGSVLEKGTAACFPVEYTGTHAAELATAPCAKRGNTVMAPSASNNRYFAGVVGKRAVCNLTGQATVELHLPGSYTQVYLKEANSVLGAVATMIVGGSDKGKFTTSVKAVGGRGCVRLLQTSIAAGLVLAEVLDGPESGGMEFITPTDAGGAITPMVGGITVFPTAVTLASNATATLADAPAEGMRKIFLCKAAMTTNKVVISVTNGKTSGGAAALATMSFNASGHVASLRWHCSHWIEQHITATKT